MIQHAQWKVLKQSLGLSVWIIVSLIALAGRAICAENLTEAKVKAAFLYNFTKFVTWPEAGAGSRSQSFTICAVGDPLVLEAIDETVTGKKVDERPLQSRHLSRRDERQGCQVLFLSGRQHTMESSESNSVGVLTVSEAESEQQSHFDTVITFVLRDGKVRFVINCAAAEKAGLTISSKLLTLAVKVEH